MSYVLTHHHLEAAHTMTEIDRAEPPYLQIARHYRELIERGELRPGDPLPSVRALATQWKVSQTTAGRALQTLQAEELVESAVGRGTSVASRPHLGNLTTQGLISHLRTTGSFYPPGYESQITFSGLKAATEQVANALGILVGAPVIARTRITRDENHRAIELSTNYIDGALAERLPALLRTEPLPEGVLGYLEQQTGLRAASGVDQYTAAVASPDQAEALEVPPGTALILERHWLATDDGTVLDYCESAEVGGEWRTRRYATE